MMSTVPVKGLNGNFWVGVSHRFVDKIPILWRLSGFKGRELYVKG